MGLEEALERLGELYGKVPDSECYACGFCCVEPHMGFVEFVLVLDALVALRTKDELKELVSRPPVLSGDFEGNTRCPLMEANLCGLRDGRPLACRMEGLPALDRLFERDTPVCACAARKTRGQDCPDETAEELVHELMEINREFHDATAEPYFLDGLNLISWFAVLFDQRIKVSPFKDLRGLVAARHELSFLSPHYVDHTGLAEKVGLIGEMTAAANGGRFKYAAKLLNRIINGFPLTGSYFVFNGELMLREFQDLTIDQD